MKFLTKENVIKFLVEINEYDASLEIKEDYIPTEQMKSKFLRKRKKLVRPIKDFRKSQQAKRSWKHNKKRIKAIRDYHTSSSGKQNSRKLANFNAKRIANVKYEDFNKYELLKCLSSISTHLFIMMEYYHDLYEEVELTLFVEDIIPEIRSIEDKIFNESDLSEADMDLLIHFTTDEDMVYQLSQVADKEPLLADKIYEYYERDHLHKCQSLFDFYTFLFEKLKLSY